MDIRTRRKFIYIQIGINKDPRPLWSAINYNKGQVLHFSNLILTI